MTKNRKQDVENCKAALSAEIASLEADVAFLRRSGDLAGVEGVERELRCKRARLEAVVGIHSKWR